MTGGIPNMKPIRAGDRGPAVEDIQKKLLSLGYVLGPTGIDGVFLDHTVEAVRAFRRTRDLGDSGIVDEETWSALVDASFVLGDRVLYLRMPFFHGSDVLELQRALTVLGFSCGAIDGIFGAFCEGAVREFQFNAGIPADGIVGAATYEAIGRLKHVWEGKDAIAHSGAHAGYARAEEALKRLNLMLVAEEPTVHNIAERVLNLALATSTDATVSLDVQGKARPESTRVVVSLVSDADRSTTPTVVFSDFDTLVARIVTAVESSGSTPSHIVIEIPGARSMDDRGAQRAAVRLLDAFCVALA